MPEGPCFNQIWSEILMKDVTPRRADNRVKKICHEYYRVEPGFVLRGVPLILTRAMLIGIDETSGRILVPFRKPCYGTSLYVINAEMGEIAQIRIDLGARAVAEQGKRTGTCTRKRRVHANYAAAFSRVIHCCPLITGLLSCRSFPVY